MTEIPALNFEYLKIDVKRRVTFCFTTPHKCLFYSVSGKADI